MGIFNSYNSVHLRWERGRRELSWCELFSSVHTGVTSFQLQQFMNLCQTRVYKTLQPTSQTDYRYFLSSWQALLTVYFHCGNYLRCIFASAVVNPCNTLDHRNKKNGHQQLTVVGFLSFSVLSPLVQLELVNQLLWFCFLKFAKEICSGTETMQVR